MRHKRIVGRLQLSAPDVLVGNLATDIVTQAGWLTYGVALKQGDATGIKFPGLTTQVDVKSSYGDGTIRHAIVTANVPTGSLAVNAGTADTGSFTPSWPTCTVTFVQSNSPGGGASAAGTYVATLGSYDASDPWLSGPNCMASSVWKTPDNGGTPHTNLRVRFDVYSYSDNKTVIDIAVENTLNNATNREFIYDITIATAGDVSHHEAAIFHLPFTVKTKQVTAGFPDIAEVQRDLTPFYRSGALPQYLSDVQDMTVANGQLSSLTAHGYDSMDGLGPFLLPMDAHGGRPEIGLHTAWVVSWIVHQRQEQYEFIQKLTEYSGNYNCHMRKADNSDIWRITNGDSTWLHPSAAAAGSPYTPACGSSSWRPTAQSVTLASNGTTATATFASGVPGFYSVGQYIRINGCSDSAWNDISFSVLSIPSSTTLTFAAPNGNTSLTGTITANILAPTGEINHLPNMAFVQYLVSGRRRAMDQMVYYANYCLLNTTAESRGFGYGYSSGAVQSSSNGAKGYLNAQGVDSYPELRGSAWGLRDLAQCGKWLPDSMSLKTYFATIAQNNIDDNDLYVAAMASAPDIYSIYTNNNTALDATFPLRRPEDQFGGAYNNKTWISGFEQPYLSNVLQFTIRNQGWTGGTTTLNKLSEFWSRLADVGQIPAPFTIAHLSPYVLACGSRTYGPSTVTFYTTLSDVYNHTYTVGAGGTDGPISGSSEQNAPFIRSLLMVAAADGYTGASAGVTYCNRAGGEWDNGYRTNSAYTPFAFSTVTVPA